MLKVFLVLFIITVNLQVEFPMFAFFKNVKEMEAC